MCIRDSVEDVVSLGDDIEVRVEDIDPNGKISLRLTSDDSGDGDSGGGSRSSDDRPRDRDRGNGGGGGRGNRDSGGGSESREVASFEDSFDASLADELGDLGPAPKSRGGRGGGGGGGGRRRR